MPGSDGSQFISMRKHGAANNPSVTTPKLPGPNSFRPPKVSGVGLTREEFLSSTSKLHRNIVASVVPLTTPPILTYTSGSIVTFPPLNGATNYKLYNNFGDALILDLGTNTSFSIPSLITPPANLSPNTSYTVYVVASNSLGPSPKSATITFTTPPAPPTMTISGTNLTIPSSAGATNYRLISSPPIVPSPTITPGTSSFSSLGLTPGTTYTLSVATTGANGIESLPGATVTVYTPPNPIQSVTYGASTSSTAVVSWSPPSVGGITGYNIYDGSTLYTTLTTPTVTFGAVSGQPALSSGTTYTNFSIKAYYNTVANESASVPLSFSTTVIINPPTNVQVTAQTENSVSLSWTPPATGNKDGFYITTVTPSGSSTVYTVPGNASVSTYTITGLSAGTTYVWNIFTYFGTVSQRSTAVVVPTAFTTPLPPTGFTATPVPGSTTLTWTAQTLPINADIIGYKIYDAPSGTIPAYTIPKTSPLSQVIIGLAAGSNYTYYITSYGNRNATPVEAVNRASVTFTTSSVSAPTGLVVSLVKSTTATFTWNATATPGITGYSIYNGSTLYTTVAPNVTTISPGTAPYPALTAATDYTINVKAYFGTTSNETPATSATFTTYGNYNTPTSFTATSSTDTTVTFTWSPTSGTHDGFFIEMSGIDNKNFIIPGASLTTYTTTTLTPGLTYAAIISAYKTTQTTQTLSPPSVSINVSTAPTAPAMLPVTNVLGKSATLTWTSPTTPNAVNTLATSYKVYNGPAIPANVYDTLPYSTNTINLGLGTYLASKQLAPNTTYTFNITSYASSILRESPTLATITFTTSRDFVAPPGGSPQSFNRYWKSITCDSTGQYVYAFDLGDMHGNVPLFYFSVDYGYTWITDTALGVKQSGSGRIINNVSMSADGSRVLCSSTHEAYTYICNNLSATSSNGTLDWQFPGGPLAYGQHNTTDSNSTSCGIMSKDGSTAYVCGNTGVNNSRVYRTVYNGTGWPDIATVGTKTYTKWAGIACSSNGQYVYAVPASPSTGKVQRFQVGVSTDWVESSYNNTDASYSAIVCSNSGQYVYAVISGVGPVYSTDYGVTWTLLGTETRPITTIVCSGDGTKVFLIENTNSTFQQWVRSGSTYVYTAMDASAVVGDGFDNYMASNDDGSKVIIASRGGGITLVS